MMKCVHMSLDGEIFYLLCQFLSNTCIHTHARTHLHTHAHAFTHTCTYTHTHARTRHAHIRIHTHTHLVTPPPPPHISSWDVLYFYGKLLCTQPHAHSLHLQAVRNNYTSVSCQYLMCTHPHTHTHIHTHTKPTFYYTLCTVKLVIAATFLQQLPIVAIKHDPLQRKGM